MTAVDTVRSVVSHRGMSCLDLYRIIGEQDREIRNLRQRAATVTAAEVRLDEQAKTINDLHVRLDNATQIKDEVNAKAGRCDEAEHRAQAAEQALAEQTAELQSLRAFHANATAQSDLPQHTSTEPIRVLTLPEALGAGPAQVPPWACREVP